MYCISHEGCYFKQHILSAASSILFRLRLLCSAPYDSNLSCFNIKIREPCKFRVCQRNLVFFRFYWLWFKCSVCLLIVALLSILSPIFVNNIRNQHVLWLKICLYSLQSNDIKFFLPCTTQCVVSFLGLMSEKSFKDQCRNLKCERHHIRI